ncbi:PREDICTED: uncharacterized protein LOC104698941 [Camelina sativa]|uniref:Uncharacterized protein LOC104698941 n=1 Tax=Camelina sativa TaxID=90675 RepID=A0ABM0SKT0_CAMSA|nr:PREDICTED: uncharacterized protein LOC104698941 [Camelina sativa]
MNAASETVTPNSEALLNVNMTNVARLTPTNYIMWSRQVHALIDGYGLASYLDGFKVFPADTVTVDGTSSPNPAYVNCVCQEKLLYSALLGAISVSIQPILSRAHTTAEIWTTLASTYAKTSRGHIRQIKLQLKNWKEDTKTIDAYLQGLTTRFDELALLGKSLDHEDQVEIILEGLPEEYKTIVDQVEGRDTPPTITELYEKLINHESKLLTTQPLLSTPITANVALPQRNNTNPRTQNRFHQRNNTNWNSSSRQPNDFRAPRPYLGRCQICGTQLALFQQQQPRANFITATPWLLNSAATHHISSDLANLSLHQPYTGGEQVVVGDGQGLPITHTGSAYLTSQTKPLSLTNVLYVPDIKKNLISVYRMCNANRV